ncbi:MAG: PQQ-binding-like beta-propeller repeat protein [Nitrosomonadales bacterium]|nr:PQQ-binding-like beta-propeller repeat protein [Nitrosomonadales bacterium]
MNILRKIPPNRAGFSPKDSVGPKPDLRIASRVLALLLLSTNPAMAALTDLGTVPMANASDTVVKPNVLFILDDSGSMAWEYLPDSVNNNNSKFCYRNNSYNGAYYNPSITYALPVDSTGASYPNASFTAASTDGFTVGATTTNLITGFQTGNDNAGTSAYYYSYKATNTPSTPVVGTCYSDASYSKVTISPPLSTLTVSGNKATTVTGITVNGLQIMAASTGATTTSSTTLATRIAAQINLCTTTISGACGVTGYSASRAGSIVTIIGPNGAATFTPVITKNTGTTMTVTATAFTAASNTDQMQNFANWYAYYRDRMLMMKSAAGLAFKQLDSKFRVGFITINPGTNTSNPVTSSNQVSASRYLAISDFTTSQKAAWYTKLYATPGAVAGTPLRTALARAGRYFGGKHDGINSGMADDPTQYSCQQNFTILTTDGYWNTMNDANLPVQLNGTSSIDDQDNVDQTTAPIYSSRATGTYDGGVGGGNTLADVAMYYYRTDLRPTGSLNLAGSNVSADDVLYSDKDFARHQHMTTFTLGLANGQMIYQADYETATSGAFYNITQGTADWPTPVSGAATALDDLWHAAVNGRGSYYNARDPGSLADGLVGALNGIMARLGSGSASAVSNPKLAASGNNFSYGTTYHTSNWIGEVQARALDPATGAESTTITWSAQAQLNAKALSASDTRTIYTFSSTAPNRLKAFLWANLTVAEQAYFANKCSTWSQCTTLNLTTADIAVGNSGQNLSNYLRGQYQYEMRATSTNPVFRKRDAVLGDIANAQPKYVKAPEWSYNDNVTPSYSTFKSNNASRQGVVYVAANDGMLHAFNADTGAELWAYLPKMVMPNLYLLAEQNYAVNHRYFVDGSPAVMDVYDSSASAWKTVLVGGLGGGGRGWYALDVTDPAAPKALWEICSDSALCAISDADMGYSYGNPVITKRASDGHWIVALTSGYNNVSTGTGRGYLYVLDALSGSVLNKLDTASGNTTTPSGLTKISAWVDNSSTDNTAKWIYGGDLNGDVWRFDLTTTTPSVTQIAALKDAAGVGQPITVQPEIGTVNGYHAVFIGTGRYLGVGDLSDTQQQSVYAFRDTGANLGNLRARNDMVVQTLTQASSTATTRTISNNAVDWSQKKGWYVDLNPGSYSPGERVSIDPILVNGVLEITANVPVSSACTTGGVGWTYLFDFSTGAAPISLGGTAMGQKNNTSVYVGATAVLLPDGRIVFMFKDATGGSSQVIPPNTNATSGRRVSWRELTP